MYFHYVKLLKNKTVLFLASFFCLGYTPVAPGTLGTLAAVPLYYLLNLFLTDMQFLLFTLIFIVISIVVSSSASGILGRADPPEIVIDEVAGFFTTMVFVPFGVVNIVLGFFLFRFFDIVKIYPLRRLERIEGGMGIVLDDIVAGVMANITIIFLNKFLLVP